MLKKKPKIVKVVPVQEQPDALELLVPPPIDEEMDLKEIEENLVIDQPMLDHMSQTFESVEQPSARNKIEGLLNRWRKVSSES